MMSVIVQNIQKDRIVIKDHTYGINMLTILVGQNDQGPRKRNLSPL